MSFGWKTLRSEDRPSAFRVTLSGALETWYSFTWELREGTYQVSGPGGRVRANAEARSSNRSVFEVKLKPLVELAKQYQAVAVAVLMRRAD